MSTKEIRQKLVEYIESAQDKKVKAIYTMVEEEIISHGLDKKTMAPKSKILKGVKQAVEEMKLIEQGKLKGIRAKDLYNEL